MPSNEEKKNANNFWRQWKQDMIAQGKMVIRPCGAIKGGVKISEEELIVPGNITHLSVDYANVSYPLAEEGLVK